MPTARLARMARAVVRRRTICSGTTGSATRVSTHTAMSSSTRPAPTMANVCQESQANELSTNETQDDADAGRDQGGAPIVDLHVRAADQRQVQRLLQQDQGEHGDRRADEEAPAPAEPAGVDDQAAEQRAAHRGEGEDAAEVPVVPAALTRRDHRRDRHLDQGLDATHAEALERAGGDQLPGALREAGHRPSHRWRMQLWSIFLTAQVFSLENGSQARYACRMTAGTAEQAPTPRGDEQARGAERAGVEEHAPGLRERKKAATRHALHEAAVRLAIAHGPARVTVEAIADEAGVSRRTFSNYFANKEEALLYGDHQRIRAMVEMVRARPAA